MPGGGAPPTLHLLHDSEGKTDVYHPLAACLEGSVRVYGVAPHSDGPFPVLFTRIDDMAAHVAQQIRKVQPTGPYAIGGLGIGGALAHAVACHLQADGAVVSSVVLFDAVDPGYKPARASGESGVYPKVDRGLAERLLASTSRLSTSLTRSGVDYARLKLLRRCLDRGERPPWYLEHIPLETIYRFAVQDYAPRSFSGRMVLYRALDSGVDPSDAPARDRCGAGDFGWRTRATLGTAIVDVSGGHRTMLAEPNVTTLARHLKQELTLALSGDRAAKRSA
jgi:thioesterase domain-containing protein